MNKEECIKGLEYTKERHKETSILDSDGLNIPAMCSDILGVLKNCIEIPEGATNGFMVKAIFPKARVSDIYPQVNGDEVYFVIIEKFAGVSIEMRVLRSWWDAPFKVEKIEMKKPMKPHNCMECENSHITIQNGYCQCKVTGNCYSPIIMADKISEDCPLYELESEGIHK